MAFEIRAMRKAVFHSSSRHRPEPLFHSKNNIHTKWQRVDQSLHRVIQHREGTPRSCSYGRNCTLLLIHIDEAQVALMNPMSLSMSFGKRHHESSVTNYSAPLIAHQLLLDEVPLGNGGLQLRNRHRF